LKTSNDKAGLLLASIRTAPFLSLTATHSRQFLFPLPRPTPPDLLPGNLPARLCKPLRNAGGLNFKEALVDTRKRTGFQPTQDLVPNFLHQGQKDPRSPLCDSDQAG
jgi:hypothetical protein